MLESEGDGAVVRKQLGTLRAVSPPLIPPLKHTSHHYRHLPVTCSAFAGLVCGKHEVGEARLLEAYIGHDLPYHSSTHLDAELFLKHVQ